MIIWLWLKPVSSDGQYIQMDKEKYPKSLICVPDSSLRDSWPCFLCKVDNIDSLLANTSSQPYSLPSSWPLHFFPFLYTKTVWWSVQAPNKSWSPASHMRSKKDSSFPLLILLSWFLAMQYPNRENSTPYKLHIRVFWGITRPSSVTYIELSVWNKRFDMWRTSFLCQRLEWQLSVYNPHMSILGDIYFCFPILLYIYWHSCVM